MPKQCPCEVALLEYIPIRCIVWLIQSYYHRDDATMIDELKYNGIDTDHPVRYSRYLQLTAKERTFGKYTHTDWSQETGRVLGDRNPLLCGEFSDRWIFEVGANGDTYTRFLGVTTGSPVAGVCSQCIITVVDDAIVVEIDKVQIDIDPRGEFGSFLDTPFVKSRRAALRAKMYSLFYLEPDDPQHALFDKVCDLAHKTIWEWIH